MTKRKRTNTGKRIGKDGERLAGALLDELGCYTAMTEIQGLAGDDKFVRDPNGKWWSVEVKHTLACSPDYVAQAKKQAKERYQRIQEELTGANHDIYRMLRLDTFTPNDWLVMWRPRNYNLHACEWLCFRRGADGYTLMSCMNQEEAPWKR